MNQKNNLTEQLSQLGLTPNQADIYLTLVENGELRIQEVANLIKIPRSSVYDNIKKLEELGLVENVIDHKHVRLKASSLAVLRHHFNEDLIKVNTSLKNLEKIEASLATLPKVQTNPATLVRYYKGLSAGRQLFWNTLQAKDTVLVYSQYGRSKFVGKKFYQDFVQESKSLHIKERVLINPTPRAINLIKRDTGSSIARTKLANLRFLDEARLVIKGETFIYNDIFAQIILDVPEINGFEIQSQDFVHMQRSIFESVWKQAQSISLS